MISFSLQTVEERLNLLKNDKTQLDNDKLLAEKQLKETEGARRNLFDKNRVNTSNINEEKIIYLFIQEHQEDLLDLVHEKEILEHKIFDLEQTAREWAQKFVDATDKQKLIQTNHENLLNNIKRQYKRKNRSFKNRNSRSLFLLQRFDFNILYQSNVRWN